MSPVFSLYYKTASYCSVIQGCAPRKVAWSSEVVQFSNDTQNHCFSVHYTFFLHFFAVTVKLRNVKKKTYCSVIQGCAPRKVAWSSEVVQFSNDTQNLRFP